MSTILIQMNIYMEIFAFPKSKREFECDNYISNNFCSEAISNPNYSSLLDCYATNKREVFLLGGLSL